MVVHKSSFYLIKYFILPAIIIGITSSSYGQNTAIDKISQVISLVEQFYKDSVDMDSLAERAIRAALEKLDPHTGYYTREEYEVMNESLKGNFEGIGISYQSIEDSVYILSVLENSPAQKAGLFPGDIIISVDDKSVSGKNQVKNNLRQLIGGKKGTLVHLKIKRPNQEQIVSFDIERDKIPVNSIDAVYKSKELIGYIHLTRFSATSAVELKKAIKELNRGEDCKAIILDLRGNGGGYLDKAVEVADEFLTEDKLIVYTQGRNNPPKNYSSTKKGDFESGKLFIWVDERSASASEIVAGAIQDWDRGTIVGRRTFGKGLVQRQFTLKDSSAIRLTIAAYYTPSGRCIQKPYDSDKSEEYLEEVVSREKNGELLTLDSTKMVDSLMYHTLVNKRKVYGGGGIFPDIFVPQDTSQVNEMHRKLSRTGIYSRSAAAYYSTHAEELQKEYPNKKQFILNYQPDNQAIANFLKHINQEDEVQMADLNGKLNPLFLHYYKAYLAKLLFDSAAYQELVNEVDPVWNTTLALVGDDAGL